MKPLGYLIAFAFVLRSATAQVAPEGRVQFDGILRELIDHVLEVKDLTGKVQTNGIEFDLNNKTLAEILAAATKGNADPIQVAELINACLRACQDCRARLLAPMTVDELKTLINWGFAPNLEISEGAANLLRKAGANEELISLLIPDDKLPTFPLAGYQTMALQHAEEYDANATEGWLKVTIELPGNSQSEFIFKHTGLFVRATRGDVAKDLGCYFNKPAPRSTDATTIEQRTDLAEVDKKTGILGARKHKLTVEASYLAADPDGRNAFKIVVVNKDATSQQCSFKLSWHVLTKPKTLTPPEQ